VSRSLVRYLACHCCGRFWDDCHIACKLAPSWQWIIDITVPRCNRRCRRQQRGFFQSLFQSNWPDAGSGPTRPLYTHVHRPGVLPPLSVSCQITRPAGPSLTYRKLRVPRSAARARLSKSPSPLRSLPEFGRLCRYRPHDTSIAAHWRSTRPTGTARDGSTAATAACLRTASNDASWN